MKGNELFSQKALEKMRTPDNLNTLLQVTNPLGWMALSAILLLLIGIVIWSFMGAFTTKADGVGLILDTGGIKTIVHPSLGRVEKILVHNGSRVRKGEVIARLDSPSMAAETITAQNDIMLSTNSGEARNRAAQFDSRNYQELVAESVVCAYDGVVEDLFIHEGGFVVAGMPICSVRCDQQWADLEGVLYVPVAKGNRVETGMMIQLAPSNVDTTKSGSLVGVVRSVSRYPLNQAAIKNEFGDEFLANWILQQAQGPVVEVRFNLVRDPQNESGYLWSSIVGKKKAITPGIFVNGSVLISRKPPIERIFYKISDWLSNR